MFKTPVRWPFQYVTFIKIAVYTARVAPGLVDARADMSIMHICIYVYIAGIWAYRLGPQPHVCMYVIYTWGGPPASYMYIYLGWAPSLMDARACICMYVIYSQGKAPGIVDARACKCEYTHYIYVAGVGPCVCIYVCIYTYICIYMHLGAYVM